MRNDTLQRKIEFTYNGQMWHSTSVFMFSRRPIAHHHGQPRLKQFDQEDKHFHCLSPSNDMGYSELLRWRDVEIYGLSTICT